MFRLGRRIGTEVPGPELKNPAAFGGSSPTISSPTAQPPFDGLHWRAEIEKKNILKNGLGLKKKIINISFLWAIGLWSESTIQCFVLGWDSTMIKGKNEFVSLSLFPAILY